jgi:2-polyprenyl-6-methoxyphenol hydroxylase-like FAD-dependent oxidoreductase
MGNNGTAARWDADVIIVGGGLSGCSLAAALADGRRRIVILEARKGRNPRFNGELIHPTGAQVLEERGFYAPLRAAGGIDVDGFACVRALDRPTTLLPYREIRGARPTGFAMDHHDMVDVLRREVAARPGVELRLGERVTNLLRKEERVVGVETASGPLRAPLVVACDGRHSKIRALLGIEESATLLSFTAALLLEGCRLPQPGYGHIFLEAWGPILAYPISARDARACIDLPKDMDRGAEAVIQRIRNDYLPFVDAEVRRALTVQLDRGDVEVAANYSIRTDECVVPGAALVGDACGCSHPLTATGMTVALTDTRLIAEALAGVPLADGAALDRALARYQAERYRYVRAREILADAMYEVFRGVDDGTRAIREGIFRYWNSAEAFRARSMALLSGHESRLPAFLREYLTVVGMSTSTVLRGEVNEPSLRGRVRSLYGLGLKSVEKLGLVARGLREGNLRVM